VFILVLELSSRGTGGCVRATRPQKHAALSTVSRCVQSFANTEVGIADNTACEWEWEYFRASYIDLSPMLDESTWKMGAVVEQKRLELDHGTKLR